MVNAVDSNYRTASRTRDDIDFEALMGRGIDGPDHHRSLGEGVQGHWRRSGEKRRLAGERLA